MKKLFYVLLIFLMSRCLFAQDNTDTSLQWKTHDKVLLVTYLIGETIDVLQTHEALSRPNEFNEMNPLIKDDTDLLISAVLSTSLIIWASNHFEGQRTAILTGCNAIKWSFVIGNHSAGVRVNLSF